VSDFVFLFRTDDADYRAAMGTPERAERSLKAWLDWIRELERGGHLKDPGQPLERTGKVVRARQVVTDGPFIETKDMLMGFIVVSARDLSHATELAAGCPMLAGHGGSVEIRPVPSAPMS
jgi:hypothetical protein